MTMRTAVTGALKSTAEATAYSIVYTYVCAYERTTKHGKEILFVDYILPIYAAILRQMVKCIALCRMWQILD